MTVGRHGIQEGPIFVDYQARREGIHSVAKLIQVIRGLPDGSVAVVGWYLPMIVVSLTESAAIDVDPSLLKRLVYLVDRPTLDTLSSSHIRIYYLEDVRELNRIQYGVDLQANGVPLNTKSSTP